jgi:hypothetical protein
LELKIPDCEPDGRGRTKRKSCPGFSLRNPHLIVVVALLVAILGVMAFARMPAAEVIVLTQPVAIKETEPKETIHAFGELYAFPPTFIARNGPRCTRRSEWWVRCVVRRCL